MNKRASRLVLGHWRGARETVQVEVRLLLLHEAKREWALLGSVAPLLSKLGRWGRRSRSRSRLSSRRSRLGGSWGWLGGGRSWSSSRSWRLGFLLLWLLLLRSLGRWSSHFTRFDLEVLEGRNVVFFLARHHDRLTDRDVLRALRHEDLGEEHVVLRLKVDNRLISLDLTDNVAGGDLVAFLEAPTGEVALLHGGRERWETHDLMGWVGGKATEQESGATRRRRRAERTCEHHDRDGRKEVMSDDDHPKQK